MHQSPSACYPPHCLAFLQDAPTGRPKRVKQRRSFGDDAVGKEDLEWKDLLKDAVRAKHTPLWAPRWDDEIAERQQALHAGLSLNIWGPDQVPRC